MECDEPTYGARIRAERRGRHLTAEQFGGIVGCSGTLVLLIEKGQRSPGVLLAHRIYQHSGIPPVVHDDAIMRPLRENYVMRAVLRSVRWSLEEGGVSGPPEEVERLLGIIGSALGDAA